MPPPIPPDLNPLLAAAAGHFRAGRLAEAAATFRQALAIAPGHAEASYNLAVTLEAMGRLDEAVAQYRFTLALWPDAKAHNNLGEILARQSRSDEAIGHYRQALALDPALAKAHFNLARALELWGRDDKALAHYELAVAIDSMRAEAHNHFGLLLQRQGRPEEARDRYSRAIALKPDYAEAHRNREKVLEVLADRPVAAPAVRARLRRLPPALVVSHERSGTHFLMNALSYGYGYTAEPWLDLDTHALSIDYADPTQIAGALQRLTGDGLLRLVKSHHAADQFEGVLDAIARDYLIFYVYREPAAVMTSFWRHLHGLPWDEGPKLADPLALAMTAPSGRLTRYQAHSEPTMLRRWAAHVEGWLAAAEANPRITPVRYEDLDGRYDQTVRRLAERIGREPLSPLLRPPRAVNVIALGARALEAPVAVATQEALGAYVRAEVGGLLGGLGY